jgi:hypothetical protein
MRDVEFRHLQSLIEFMYAGEVNVAQAHLSSFLRTAESLQIRGLTEAPQRHKQDPKDKVILKKILISYKLLLCTKPA